MPEQQVEVTERPSERHIIMADPGPGAPKTSVEFKVCYSTVCLRTAGLGDAFVEKTVIVYVRHECMTEY